MYYIIIKILKDENVELKDIINNSIKYPEQLINYTNLTESKFIRIKDLENKIKNDLDKKILFRKSGTEDLYRLYISCKDKNDSISILNEIDDE